MNTLLDVHDMKDAYYHGKRGEWFVVLATTNKMQVLWRKVILMPQ